MKGTQSRPRTTMRPVAMRPKVTSSCSVADGRIFWLKSRVTIVEAELKTALMAPISAARSAAIIRPTRPTGSRFTTIVG
jgi:hypothetical protein